MVKKKINKKDYAQLLIDTQIEEAFLNEKLVAKKLTEINYEKKMTKKVRLIYF